MEHWVGEERRKRMSGINFEECPLGVKHEAEISAMKCDIGTMAKDIKDMKERLLGRPSWVVTVIISLLSTLAFSALTFAFTIIREAAKLGIKT